MRNILSLLLQISLGIVLPAWIVEFDEKRLGEARLVLAWPPSSFWCAVVAFGPLCIPIHFLRTRRSVSGLALGTIWSLAVVTVQVGLGRLLWA